MKRLTPVLAAAAALAFAPAAFADSYPSQKPGPYPGAKHPGAKHPGYKHPGYKHPGSKHPSQKHPSYKSPGYSSHGAPGYSGKTKWGPGNSGK